MDEELDTTSQAVEALLFLSTDQGNAPNGIRRPARQISKAVSARQSDNGFDGRVHKKGRHTKVTPRPIQGKIHYTTCAVDRNLKHNVLSSTHIFNARFVRLFRAIL